MCDIIIAADNAKFGQPEIKLGVIPGIGGTQRLTRAVGKAKAMDLILTGRMMDAAEAERSGLVARVVPAASLMDEAMKVAETIAAMSLPSVLCGQGGGQPRLRDDAGRGRALRAARVPRAVRDRGPEGRHGGLRREAAGEISASMSWRFGWIRVRIVECIDVSCVGFVRAKMVDAAACANARVPAERAPGLDPGVAREEPGPKGNRLLVGSFCQCIGWFPLASFRQCIGWVPLASFRQDIGRMPVGFVPPRHRGDTRWLRSAKTPGDARWVSARRRMSTPKAKSGGPLPRGTIVPHCADAPCGLRARPSFRSVMRSNEGPALPRFLPATKARGEHPRVPQIR